MFLVEFSSLSSFGKERSAKQSHVVFQLLLLLEITIGGKEQRYQETKQYWMRPLLVTKMGSFAVDRFAKPSEVSLATMESN